MSQVKYNARGYLVPTRTGMKLGTDESCRGEGGT